LITEKITTGVIVEPISPNRGMVIFKTPSGGKFIKVKQENHSWKGVTLLDYKGSGLVVFLANLNETNHLRKIGPGEILKPEFNVKITSVFDKHAIGEIVTEEKSVSFEMFFNNLISEIDRVDSPDSLKFDNILFGKSEYETLMKLQAAFHSLQKKPCVQVSNLNEDRIDSINNGNH